MARDLIYGHLRYLLKSSLWFQIIFARTSTLIFLCIPTKVNLARKLLYQVFDRVRGAGRQVAAGGAAHARRLQPLRQPAGDEAGLQSWWTRGFESILREAK